ncbi:MAG: hypothetical protein ACRDPY_39815 [Streptosporangiaceae bacterium]
MSSASPARLLPGGYGPEPVDPRPDTPAFPRHAVRPGIQDSEIPVFGAPGWQLSLLDEKATAVSVPLIWDQFPATLAPAFRGASWALINIPTPEVIQSRAGSSTRSRLRPSSLSHTVRAWKGFAHWLHRQGVATLAEVTRDLLSDYAAGLRDHDYRRDYCQRQLLALTRLWAYAPYLLPADRIPRPPWDDGDAEEYLTAPAAGAAGDNARIPIHPATMSPLLVCALRFITDFADDILAALAESRRLRARIREQAHPDGTRIVGSYLAGLREQGRPIPGLPAGGCYARAISAREHRPARPTVNVRYIAGLLGVTTAQVKHVTIRQPHNISGMTIAATAPLAARPTGRIGASPWLQEIDFDEALVLAMHLSTAALITVAYLSGMRPEEVLHLRRGCCSTGPGPASQSSDGIIRYQVNGHHFKGALDEDGNQIGAGEVRDQPWTVIAPVAAAIAVLERLEDDDLLFPRRIGSVLARPRPAAAWRGAALTPAIAAERIAKFAVYASQLAERHGRSYEMIPADPDGPLNMSRFRRTAAWFISRLPGGRVALGIQYGHVHLAMSESYGNRSRTDLLEIIDLEQARSIADTLADAAGRLRDGEGVSGPAASRYIASADEFTVTYGGACLTKRQHKALLANPGLRVFDNDQAILACNHNPMTALCDPERGKPGKAAATPSHDRCDPACANIARTDTHIARIRQQIQCLDEETAAGLNPAPIQQRLTQRRTWLQSLVDKHYQARVHAVGLPAADRPEETL